jgi:hypothetical protein
MQTYRLGLQDGAYWQIEFQVLSLCRCFWNNGYTITAIIQLIKVVQGNMRGKIHHNTHTHTQKIKNKKINKLNSYREWVKRLAWPIEFLVQWRGAALNGGFKG